jgi:hypothetical protein
MWPCSSLFSNMHAANYICFQPQMVPRCLLQFTNMHMLFLRDYCCKAIGWPQSHWTIYTSRACDPAKLLLLRSYDTTDIYEALSLVAYDSLNLIEQLAKTWLCTPNQIIWAIGQDIVIYIPQVRWYWAIGKDVAVMMCPISNYIRQLVKLNMIM